jgi:hypothetical protein
MGYVTRIFNINYQFHDSFYAIDSSKVATTVKMAADPRQTVESLNNSSL